MNPHYATSEDHRRLTHNSRVEPLELARSQPSRCRATLMAPISLSMKVWFDLKDDQMRPLRPQASRFQNDTRSGRLLLTVATSIVGSFSKERLFPMVI